MTYKKLHENFMSNHKGSTIWECFFLIAIAPLLVYFVSYIIIVSTAPRLSLFSFLVEYTLFIVPIILFYTVFNAYNHLFFYCLLAGFIISLFHTIRKRNKKFIKIIFTIVLPSQKRAYITYYRAICNILSALCILAVDFTIFPRRFAKAETYGFGIMDTGVGFYILSNALVTKVNIKEHFSTSIKSSIPLLGLGILRCISLNALDYNQHVSEYGLYWNFFFTLAVLNLTCPVVLSYFPNSSGWISLFLAIIHQLGLNSGLEAWVVGDSPREGFLSANREGLVSLPGYASLYFAGVFIGRIHTRDNIDLQEDLLRAFKSFVASGVFFFLTFVLKSHFDVSRRLMNITYVAWLIAFSLLLIGIIIIIEIAVRIASYIEGCAKSEVVIPIIVDAVNYNGLFFFILANLFTGIVNLSIKTLLMPSFISLLILMVYMLFLCYVVSFMYRHRIRIRL